MVSKAEYLKKYLSVGKKEEDVFRQRKRRRKIKSSANTNSGMRVVEHDVFGFVEPSEEKADLSDDDDEETECQEQPFVRLSNCATDELKLLGKFKTSSFQNVSNSDVKGKEEPRRNVRHDSDTDQSPVRRPRRDSDQSQDLSPKRRKGNRSDSDSDSSVSRIKVKREPNESDTDQSPTRRKSSAKKMRKTIDGKIAGLQSATDLRKEAKRLKKRDEQIFSKINDEVSGRNASTIVRDKKTGAKKVTAEDEARKRRERLKQSQLDEQYKYKWNVGVKQLQERNKKLEEMAQVLNEPFARRADDEAMNEHLRQTELKEDPMLDYVRKKTDKKKARSGSVYPRYTGPAPAPNRYGIWPGYRWDGIDRSGGFENKLFASQNEKKSQTEQFYKWSMGAYE